ncbi:hypothetical protein MTO96_044061 [Rhipicephalus appendiculatus]
MRRHTLAHPEHTSWPQRFLSPRRRGQGCSFNARPYLHTLKDSATAAVIPHTTPRVLCRSGCVNETTRLVGQKMCLSSTGRVTESRDPRKRPPSVVGLMEVERVRRCSLASHEAAVVHVGTVGTMGCPASVRAEAASVRCQTASCETQTGG